MKLVIWSKPSRMNDNEYPSQNTGPSLKMAFSTPPLTAGLHATPALGAKVALVEEESREQSLGSHDVQNEDRLSVDPVEDSARRHDHFAVWRPEQFRRPSARLREPLQLIHTPEHPLNQQTGR